MESYSEYLEHYGVKGMRWGVRRYRNEDGTVSSSDTKRYRSTSLAAVIAKKKNEKIDKSFEKWKQSEKNRAIAITAGKELNKSKLLYQNNKSIENKKDMIEKRKEYKKALSKNTIYSKGVIKQEVGQDISRKYLSEAKRIKKKLDKDPNNAELSKRYSDLMSKHDVERAKARRVLDVAKRRSIFKASLKRKMTMTVKVAAFGAGATATAKIVNDYLEKSGKSININSEDLLKYVKIGKRMFSYI